MLGSSSWKTGVLDLELVCSCSSRAFPTPIAVSPRYSEGPPSHTSMMPACISGCHYPVLRQASQKQAMLSHPRSQHHDHDTLHSVST